MVLHVFSAIAVDTDPHHAPGKFEIYNTPLYANMSEEGRANITYILPQDCKAIFGELTGPGTVNYSNF